MNPSPDEPSSSVRRPPQKYRRRRKFIEPKLQMRFVVAFACTAGLAALVQAVVVVNSLASLAQRAPHDKEFLLESIPGVLMVSLAATLALLVPLSIACGVYMTFPIVGPIYRFRCFLREVAAGEAHRPCKIREGDDLQDLCDLLNQAVEPLIAKEDGESGADEQQERKVA